MSRSAQEKKKYAFASQEGARHGRARSVIDVQRINDPI